MEIFFPTGEAIFGPDTIVLRLLGDTGTSLSMSFVVFDFDLTTRTIRVLDFVEAPLSVLTV